METDCPPGGSGRCGDGKCPFWVNGKCFPDKRLLEGCDCLTWGKAWGWVFRYKREEHVHKRHECWKCMLYFKKIARAKDMVDEVESDIELGASQ